MNSRLTPFGRFKLADYAPARYTLAYKYEFYNVSVSTALHAGYSVAQVSDISTLSSNIMTPEAYDRWLCQFKSKQMSESDIQLMLQNSERPDNAEVLFYHPALARMCAMLGTPEYMCKYSSTVMAFYQQREPQSALELLGRALYHRASFDFLVAQRGKLQDNMNNEDERYFLAALALTDEFAKIEYLSLWSELELRGEIDELSNVSLEHLRLRRALIGVAYVIAEYKERKFLGIEELQRLRRAYKQLRQLLLASS